VPRRGLLPTGDGGGTSCEPFVYFGAVQVNITWVSGTGQSGTAFWTSPIMSLPQISGTQSPVYIGVSLNIPAAEIQASPDSFNTIPLVQGNGNTFAWPDGTYSYRASWDLEPPVDGGAPSGFYASGAAGMASATCTLCGGEPVPGTGCNGPGMNLPLDGDWIYACNTNHDNMP